MTIIYFRDPDPGLKGDVAPVWRMAEGEQDDEERTSAQATSQVALPAQLLPENTNIQKTRRKGDTFSFLFLIKRTRSDHCDIVLLPLFPPTWLNVLVSCQIWLSLLVLVRYC